MTKIYIASKLRHAEPLRIFFSQMRVHIVSRWLDMVQFEDQATSADFIWCWLIDENDVRSCDVLVVYGEPDDELRGALVEAGMALILGKLVIVVGECKSYGSWRHHPQVIQVNTLDQARHIIEEWRV